MFDTGKKIDRLQQSLQQWFSREEQKGEGLKAQEDGAFLKIAEQMEKLTIAAGEQASSVTDMLDTWEEWQDRQAAQAESLQVRLLEKAEKELAEKAGRENTLLEMAVSAWDQLFTLRLAAWKTGDESWQRQLELAESILKEKAAHAGLQQTGLAGERFSYEIHEATERVDTDQRAADMTIAEVFSPGYWYRGQLLRKSRVAVYRVTQEEKP